MIALALALALSAPPAAAPEGAAAAPAAGPAGEPAPDQAPDQARAEVSRRAVRLGEPFEVAVALRHDPGEEVDLLPGQDLSPFSLRSAECRRTAGERSAVTTCTLVLQLLDLGERQLAPLRLRVRGPGGERVATAPGAAVRGLGAADPGTAAPPLRRPPAPPLLVPSWRFLGWVAAGLLALAAAWLWWRGRRPPARPAAPALPPHPRLAQRIAEVLALDLPGRGRGREHLVRIADAVREYLAAVSPGAALDLTSAELAAELAGRPVAGVDRAGLSRLLAAADLVKFARHQPGPGECQEASAFARALVERTRPAPAGDTPSRGAA